jgi:hypothetical protein
LRTVLRMVVHTLQKSYRNLVCISCDQYCLFPRASAAWVQTITDCWPSVTGNVCVTMRQQQPGYRLSAQEHCNSLDRRLYSRRIVNAKLVGRWEGGGGLRESRAKRHKEAGVVRSVPIWANSEPSKNTSHKYNGRWNSLKEMSALCRRYIFLGNWQSLTHAVPPGRNPNPHHPHSLYAFQHGAISDVI